MKQERVGKTMLLEFLKEVDKKLSKQTRVFAVGGTAMTLLGIKASTKDIDFNLEPGEFGDFKKALAKTIHGYRIDLYCNGAIFTQQLPEDYVKKAVRIDAPLKNILLYSINPVDIIATKIGRMDERDFEDIIDCIKKCKITKKQIEQRAKQVIYAGNEELYAYNLQSVLRDAFKKTNVKTK
jgi:hypothetical protein